ncbi:MAG TPA: pentapeptide repeat-containing protein [Archangium sp.]|nr:pentapeptide repeat-containing protein [Archangium sp.]
MATALGAEVDEVAKWDKQQLREYLLRSLGPERAPRLIPLLDQLEQQPELISRPLLLELLLLRGAETSTEDETLKLGTLFQRFTDRWIQQGERSALPLSLEQWQGLFERLARELRGRPQGRLHQHQFLEFLRESLDKNLSTPDIGRLELALRSAPFLTRSQDGYYQFAFKLFEEFFFARHLLRTARAWKLEEALDLGAPTSECAAFLAEDTDLAPLRQGVMKILGAPYRPRRSENALRLAYELACRLAGKAGRQSQREMAEFIPHGASLEGADLRGGQWPFAWFRGARLTGARLDGVDLTQANLEEIDGHGLIARGCILDGARFDAAFLQGADFAGSTALNEAPILQRANLRGVLLRGTAWRTPGLRHAYLDSPDIALARWSPPGFEEQNGQEVSLAFAHPGLTIGLAVSPDGTLLLTCAGSTPVLWDLLSGRPLITFAGHTQLVAGIAFSPDGKRVASASLDASVGLWDVVSGKFLHRLSTHPAEARRVAFSPDGALLAAGFNDGSVRVWDSGTGELFHVFEGHTDAVLSITFAPEGALLATGSKDHTIRIWDILSKKHVRTLSGHQGAVRSVAFHPQTSFQLASASVEGKLKLWDIAQGTATDSTLENPLLFAMAFNGEYLAALSQFGELIVWSAKTRTLARRVQLEGAGGGLAFVTGGTNQLAAVTTRTMLLEHPDAALGVTMAVGAGAVASVFLSKERIALGGEDGVVRVWDTRTGASPLLLSMKGGPVLGLDASPDGARLATASWAGPVQLWDMESGKPLMVLSDIEHLNQLAFSPDGQRLAGAGTNNTEVWDVSTTQPRRLFGLTGHAGPVVGIVFSPDGGLIATASMDRTVQLWDGRTGANVLVLKEHSQSQAAYRVAFSPDGSLLASAGEDSTVHLWSIPSGKPLVSLKARGNTVRCIAFSPDGNQLLTGLDDDTAQVWTVREGRYVSVLHGHNGPVTGVSFSPDGHHAMTASLDGTARLWDTATWRHIATFVWLDKGWATLAGSYAFPSPDMDLDRLVVRAGAKCAPLSLFRDQCIRPDLVQAALAGRPVAPLKLDLGAAERMQPGNSSHGS